MGRGIPPLLILGLSLTNMGLSLTWVMVSQIFNVHPYLGKWSNLTNILQMGWNHQLVIIKPLFLWCTILKHDPLLLRLGCTLQAYARFMIPLKEEAQGFRRPSFACRVVFSEGGRARGSLPSNVLMHETYSGQILGNLPWMWLLQVGFYIIH